MLWWRILLLRHGSASARIRAASGFAATGTRKATKALVRALSDREPKVQRHAVKALGRIGSPEALGALASRLRSDRRDLDVEFALRAGGDPARAALAPLLADPSAQVRAAAVRCLPDSPGTALGSALQALEDPDAAVRLEAVGALKRITAATPGGADEQVLTPLDHALRDRADLVRAEAVTVLAGSRAPDATRMLASALSDRARPVRNEAARALYARSWVPRDAREAAFYWLAAWDAAWSSVQRTTWGVQASHETLNWIKSVCGSTPPDPGAVERVPTLETTDAVEPLLLHRIRWAGGADVRNDAVIELARRLWTHLAAPVRLQGLHRAIAIEASPVRFEAIQEIGSDDGALLDDLRPLLDHSDPTLRRVVGEAVVRIGGEEAIETLTRLLSDPSGSVRHMAAVNLPYLLQRTGRPATVELVLRLLEASSGPNHGLPERLAELAADAGIPAEFAVAAAEALGYRTIDIDPRHGHEVPSLDAGSAALARLCAVRDPFTTAVLKLVARKADVTVSLACCAWTHETRIDFAAQRACAVAELERRGAIEP